MKYRIIQMVEGKMIKTELNDENLHPALEVRGFDFVGLENNPHLRNELKGEPKFTGLLGPMWDGDAIRYEDFESYKILST
jgi:hypothetical protein